MQLHEWLAHGERLHSHAIELGLDRVQRVWARLDRRFEAVVFTVAGTNGKGSTCAMLERILLDAGYRVGVYTSPHLVHFEERCRLQGQPVAAAELLAHFEAVEAVRGDTPLTYFEFTTLVILRLLSEAALDAVVLEVGLGGRLDAVNVIDTDCAIITSIDIDHTQWLGHTREAIGAEKAGIMRGGRPVVVSDPMPPSSVIERAETIGADLWLSGRDFRYEAQQGTAGTWQQWSWSGRGKRYAGLAYPALRGINQLLNAAGVLAALEARCDRLAVPAQAVRTGLSRVELPGRFQILPGRPALVLDVAHNPHAVAALAQNLDQMGFYPRTHAVFGAMADKDVAAMVERLAPWVDDWYCCELPTPRAASARALAEAIAVRAPEAAVSQWSGPVAALRAAFEAAAPEDRILVFGSFFTVGGVLADGLPRRSSAHTPPRA